MASVVPRINIIVDANTKPATQKLTSFQASIRGALGDTTQQFRAKTLASFSEKDC